MKKLLLSLLCVPMIIFGQINVVNSNQTTIIGQLEGNQRSFYNTSSDEFTTILMKKERKRTKEEEEYLSIMLDNQMKSFCASECAGIKIETNNNKLFLCYDNHNVINCVPPLIRTKSPDNPEIDYEFATIIEINDDGTVLEGLFNIIIEGFDDLDVTPVNKCNGVSNTTTAMFNNQSGTWNIVKYIELDVGQTDLLILEWIGSKFDGEMWFKYKENKSFLLSKEDIYKLFGK